MSEMMDMGLGWLFLSAFTSATLLPGSSEVLLGAMAAKGEWSMASLLLWATLGNTLGSMTTWWLVGDGLCLLAGWLRLSFWRSLILIGLGKLFRYALVFLLASHIF